MEHGPGQDPAPTPAAGPANPVQPPTVDGRPVTELGLLIQPSPMGPMFLVTRVSTHEFSRVYYGADSEGRVAYSLGLGGARLGEHTCVACDVVRGQGAVVRFNTGHLVRIPEGAFHLTWRP